jgi:hypothetical protein
MKILEKSSISLRDGILLSLVGSRENGKRKDVEHVFV